MSDHSPQLNSTQFLKTLKRRKWLFGAITLLTFLAVLAGQAARVTVTEEIPTFRSTVSLLVTPPTPSTDEGTGDSLQTWFASEQLLRQLVLSEEVLSRVIKTSGSSLDWQQLRSMVSLAPASEGEEWGDLWHSFLIDLAVESDAPDEAQHLAQVLVQEFIAYTQELAAREVIASRQLLERMALANKKKIEDYQQKIVAWRKANDVWDIDQLIEAQGQRISELNGKREDKLQDLAHLNQEVKELEAYRDGTIETLPWDVVELDSNLNQLAAARGQEKVKLEKLRKLYTDQSAPVKEQMEAYQQANEAYEQERQALVSSLLRSRQAKVAQVQAVVLRIEDDMKALKNDKNLASSQVELEQLKSQLQSYQANYEDLTSQINDARVLEQRRRHLAAFTVVEKPLLGVQINNPDRMEDSPWETALASAMLAIATGLLCTLGLEHFFLGVRLRPQVEQALGLPVLGMLPRLSEADSRDWAARGFDPQRKNPEPRLPGSGVLVDQSPDSLAAERFRSLIVQLLRLEEPPRRILVGSCWPGEGKSLVCANLAAGLTRFGVGVSLVDGDLRRPNLTHAFGTEGEPGFRQYLAGEVPVEELTASISVEGVRFLPAGTGHQNAAELLAEKRPLANLLGDDPDRFLIIDSPPLSVCSDALLLSDQADGVLLVINSDHWDGQAEVEYVQELEDSGVKILGLILNGVHPSELSHGYLSRYQKYYSPKGSQAKKKQALK